MPVNRSAIVNCAQTQELQPAQYGDCQAVLGDGTMLPLSRSRRGRLDLFWRAAQSPPSVVLTAVKSSG